MKNKLNVFAAVFIAMLSGVEAAQDNYYAAAFSGMLVIMNLLAAGFFESAE